MMLIFLGLVWLGFLVWAKTVPAKAYYRSPEYYLRNLLAVIHRDGGHYTEEHGLEQSSLDAQKIVADLRAEHEELEWEMRGLRK